MNDESSDDLRIEQGFYARIFSSSVVDLHIAVTGLGLLYVAFVFTRWSLVFPRLMVELDYLLRLGAFVLVLLFSVFQAVSYDAHLWMHEDREPDRTKADPNKLILMFVIDILSVGVAAAMFAAVSVTPLWDEILASKDLSRARMEFALGPGRVIALLGLAALWSGLTTAWYAADGGDTGSLRWHRRGFFGALVLLLVTVGVVELVGERAGTVVGLGAFLLYVVLHLVRRAPRVIEKALGASRTRSVAEPG